MSMEFPVLRIWTPELYDSWAFCAAPQLNDEMIWCCAAATCHFTFLKSGVYVEVNVLIPIIVSFKEQEKNC